MIEMLKKCTFFVCLILLTPSGMLLCDKKKDLEELFSRNKAKYALVAVKKDFRLYVYDRQGNKVATYPMGYGSNPDKKAKLWDGDRRTPEGEYHITEMQSLDAPKNMDAFKRLTIMNNVYFSTSQGLHKYNNPKEDLGKDVYGPRFFRLSYPNQNDKTRYNDALQKGEIPEKNGKAVGIGGPGIAIHGNNDEPSIGHLCSRGCLRMHNKDIIELEKYVNVRTPVLIYAE